MEYLRVSPDDVVADFGPPLFQGGEASVYRHRDKALKIYHQPTTEHRQKLDWQIRNPLPPPPNGPPDLAWPERLVFKDGQCVGYETHFYDAMYPFIAAIDIETRQGVCPN